MKGNRGMLGLLAQCLFTTCREETNSVHKCPRLSRCYTPPAALPLQDTLAEPLRYRLPAGSYCALACSRHAGRQQQAARSCTHRVVLQPLAHLLAVRRQHQAVADLEGGW